MTGGVENEGPEWSNILFLAGYSSLALSDCAGPWLLTAPLPTAVGTGELVLVIVGLPPLR